MQKSLVITILGDDKAGLVNSISDVMRAHGGNWMESRMVHLDGKFAGLLRASVNDQNFSHLTSALKALQDDDLQINIETADSASQDTSSENLRIELMGQDRPGIIDDITGELAKLNINIEEMCTEQRSAQMSNETLFFAQINMSLPENISPEMAQDSLEQLSDQLMVDIDFD